MHVSLKKSYNRRRKEKTEVEERRIKEKKTTKVLKNTNIYRRQLNKNKRTIESRINKIGILFKPEQQKKHGNQEQFTTGIS